MDKLFNDMTELRARIVTLTTAVFQLQTVAINSGVNRQVATALDAVTDAAGELLHGERAGDAMADVAQAVAAVPANEGVWASETHAYGVRYWWFETHVGRAQVIGHHKELYAIAAPIDDNNVVRLDYTLTTWNALHP